MSHNTNDFTNVSHSRCYRISSTSSIKIGWGKRAFVWCIMLCVPILLFSQQITGDKFDSYVDSLSSDTIHISHHPKMQKLKKKVKHTGSILYRFVKSFDDYDTTYISPNYYNYTAMLQNTNYFQVYKLQGRGENGIRQTIATKPAPNVKIGPYFGWRWIFLGYTFDVSHPKALGESSELDFSLYSSMLGCDFVYIKNTGNYRLRRATGFEGVDPYAVHNMAFTGLDAKTLSFSAYYVFNHRHFSYPAAYNQSTVQRKSCGSALLGMGYSNQHVSFDYTKLPQILLGGADNDRIVDELKFSKVNYDYYYVSAGYGYNWVFARNCLLGASVMPSVGIRKAKGEKLKGNEVLMDLKNFSCDVTSRVGLVWNNAHWFAGASFISHLYMYRKDRLSLTNSVNFANIYVGFFFNRKKQYR